MGISTTTIDAIKARIRIEEIVSDYLNLQQKGTKLWACCPFHQEKTPSFTVNIERGIFKCFGCGKVGDAITFLQEINGLSYPEAIETIAQKYGISISYDSHHVSDSSIYQTKESLYILMDYAKKYYAQQLLEHREAQHLALSYFKKRGIRKSTLIQFHIGYSLQKADVFVRHLLEKGYRKELLIESGLIFKERLHERFFGRILFPIHNLAGKTIGFGARSLSEQTPKYINSPQTPIYEKSEVLYGLPQARAAMRNKKSAYLVEGYMDVLAMSQVGIEEVVATAGTALTSKQAQLLSRFTKEITLLYDGDPAGVSATLRSIDLLLSENIDVFVVHLPSDHDPDSFLREKGKNELLSYIKEHKQNFLDFKATQLLSSSQAPQARAAAIEQIIATIACIPNPLVHASLIKTCSEKFELSEEILHETLSKFLGKSSVNTAQALAPAQPEAPKPARILQEEEILYLLLHYGRKNLQDSDTTNLKHSLAAYIYENLKDLHFTSAYAPLFKHLHEHFTHQVVLYLEDILIIEDKDLRSSVHALLKSCEVRHSMYKSTSYIEESQCGLLARKAILRLKRLIAQQEMYENIQQLKSLEAQDASIEAQQVHVEKHRKLKDFEQALARELQSVMLAT